MSIFTYLYSFLPCHSSQTDYLYNTITGNSVKVHPSAQVGRNTRLLGEVTLEKDVYVSWNCRLAGEIHVEKGTNINGHNTMIGGISIGKYCAIAPRARVSTADHPTCYPSMQGQLHDEIGAETGAGDVGDSVEIGNDVWICADAKILSGVTVGNGAIIGANAVVVDDVDPYSLVAGNPAEHKKYRFDAETREVLNKIEWWNWSKKKMQDNKSFFEADLRQVDDIRSLINE